MESKRLKKKQKNPHQLAGIFYLILSEFIVSPHEVFVLLRLV